MHYIDIAYSHHSFFDSVTLQGGDVRMYYLKLYNELKENCENGFLDTNSIYQLLNAATFKTQQCKQYFPMGFFKTLRPYHDLFLSQSGDFFVVDRFKYAKWELNDVRQY